jgi:hypothetical protein
MTGNDPNEAYEVVPLVLGPHRPPRTWWTVERDDLPVRHFPGKEKLSYARLIQSIALVYLVELDGGVTDEQSVDPGAFPPART